jgi:hypothetical protein
MEVNLEQMLRQLAAQNTLMVSRITALEKLVASGALHIGTVSDPAPDGGGWGGTGGRGGFGGVFGGIAGGIGTIFDPAPDELGKLSKVQLESRLAEVAHIRTKLNLLESTLKEAAGRL